ncbi:MAG TPA: acetate/propionate family kinase [Gammaproteobacteria bacterium]
MLLICNAGSSSLKAELFERRGGGVRSLARGAVERIGTGRAQLRIGGDTDALGRVDSHGRAAALLLERLGAAAGLGESAAARIAATGHRVVHGGDRYASPVRVTPNVYRELESLAHLAPLHNPPALEVMRAVDRMLPDAPMVAAFDTAFFRALPEHVRRYAIPAAWSVGYGIERFGFHGIAHEWLARRLAELNGGAPPPRAVTLQLGHGCSAAALAAGRPVETSMGFTPLEGLIMATRPGDVDPGVLLYLSSQGYSREALDEGLNREAGLKGLSDASGDMRELLALEARGHAGAALAVTAFCHRVRKYLGAYAAVLGGLDAIAFGGGIGEHAPAIRARICEGLRWLGFELDAAANEAAVGREGRISTPSSSIDAFVVSVREEQLIAERMLTLLEAA